MVSGDVEESGEGGAGGAAGWGLDASGQRGFQPR
jgi:hypothetical protein